MFMPSVWLSCNSTLTPAVQMRVKNFYMSWLAFQYIFNFVVVVIVVSYCFVFSYSFMVVFLSLFNFVVKCNNLMSIGQYFAQAAPRNSASSSSSRFSLLSRVVDAYNLCGIIS